MVMQEMKMLCLPRQHVVTRAAKKSVDAPTADLVGGRKWNAQLHPDGALVTLPKKVKHNQLP
jgi:hypothetical protein